MTAESCPRSSGPGPKPDHCAARSHTPAPAINDPGSGSRPLNTRAPFQVTPKDENSSTFGRSIESRSGTEPYIPYRSTELARKRCAHAHHPTAVTRLFCTHTSRSSRPRIASTSMVSRKSVLTSDDIQAGPGLEFATPRLLTSRARSTNDEGWAPGAG